MRPTFNRLLSATLGTFFITCIVNRYHTDNIRSQERELRKRDESQRERQLMAAEAELAAHRSALEGEQHQHEKY